jgi:hypothetical protein
MLLSGIFFCFYLITELSPNFSAIHEDYRVIMTDYDNYSLVWGCREVENGVCVFEDSWILSRTPSLSAAHRALIEPKITEACLNNTGYFITQHNRGETLFYYFKRWLLETILKLRNTHQMEGFI